MKLLPLPGDKGAPRVEPIKGLVHANRKSVPYCAVCAGPINWMFEGSDTCRTCRAKAEREAA